MSEAVGKTLFALCTIKFHFLYNFLTGYTTIFNRSVIFKCQRSILHFATLHFATLHFAIYVDKS